EGVDAIGLDTGLIRSFGGVELPVATDDDLTVVGLAPVKVASEPLALPVGEFERGLLIAVAPRFIVGVVAPVVVRFERADAVKYSGRHGSCGPHLAAHSEDWDMQTEHSTEGATPWTGG